MVTETEFLKLSFRTLRKYKIVGKNVNLVLIGDLTEVFIENRLIDVLHLFVLPNTVRIPKHYKNVPSPTLIDRTMGTLCLSLCISSWVNLVIMGMIFIPAQRSGFVL